MSVAVISLRFERGEATAREVQEVVDELLSELVSVNTTTTAGDECDTPGPTAAALTAATITVSEDRHGADPFSVLLVVDILLRVGDRSLDKLVDLLWDDIVAPRIKRRLGARAVGKRRR